MKPNEIMIDLREIRQANKITQEVIGDKAGYHRSDIIRYEAGSRSPRLDMVCNWAEALGYELVLRPVKS